MGEGIFPSPDISVRQDLSRRFPKYKYKGGRPPKRWVTQMKRDTASGVLRALKVVGPPGGWGRDFFFVEGKPIKYEDTVSRQFVFHY